MIVRCPHQHFILLLCFLDDFDISSRFYSTSMYGFDKQITNTAIFSRSCDRPHREDMPEAESPLGQWPHGLSSMLACLGCTVGLFNISRFALLTVHYGANFIFQFFLLSLVVGLPLLTLNLCLGQQLGSGVIDMWRISPLFQVGKVYL